MDGKAQKVTETAESTTESEPVIETEIKESKQPTICALCNDENLISKVFIRRCLSPDCNRVYCLHYASTVDPNICSYCLSDVTCIIETGRSIHTNLDEDTGIKHSYSRRFKSIKFTGLDWLFQQRKISMYTNDELAVGVEYHRAIMQGIVLEQEQRKIAQFQRNAGKATSTSILGINATVKSSTTTVKKVRKTKTITPASPADIAAQINMLVVALLKKGISKEDILKATAVKK